MRTDPQALFAANRAAIRQAGLPDPGTVPAGRPRAGSQGRAGGGPRAEVHVPARAAGAALPLVCMLHGCNQDAASFAAATRMNELADRHGFAVVYPQQQRNANQQGCWNWFDPAHQTRGGGEPAAIAAIVGELVGGSSGPSIDRGRVFVAGLSAGGAMAAILALTYPDVFAAVAVHSGLPYGVAGNVPGAFEVMRRGAASETGIGEAAHAAMGGHERPVPSLVIHGCADRTVAPLNGEQLLRQMMSANRLAAPALCDPDPARPARRSESAAGDRHAYTTSEWHDARGELLHQSLLVDGLGHAWSGGTPGGSFTDPRGPDASAAIWRFFDRVTRSRARAAAPAAMLQRG
jgi:poly(hydroxyalkanoate) depolymerase family esterase